MHGKPVTTSLAAHFGFLYAPSPQLDDEFYVTSYIL